jgi:hypothetical protein
MMTMFKMFGAAVALSLSTAAVAAGAACCADLACCVAGADCCEHGRTADMHADMPGMK